MNLTKNEIKFILEKTDLISQLNQLEEEYENLDQENTDEFFEAQEIEPKIEFLRNLIMKLQKQLNGITNNTD